MLFTNYVILHTMRIDIISVLPEMIEGFVNESILARAQKKGLAEIHLHTCVIIPSTSGSVWMTILMVVLQAWSCSANL